MRKKLLFIFIKFLIVIIIIAIRAPIQLPDLNAVPEKIKVISGTNPLKTLGQLQFEYQAPSLFKDNQGPSE